MMLQISSDIYFVNGTGMNPADVSICASVVFPADLRVRTSVCPGKVVTTKWTH